MNAIRIRGGAARDHHPRYLVAVLNLCATLNTTSTEWCGFRTSLTTRRPR